MNAMVIVGIGERYQRGEIDFPEASLLLITEGCNAAEAKKILDKYAPVQKEEEGKIK